MTFLTAQSLLGIRYKFIDLVDILGFKHHDVVSIHTETLCQLKVERTFR